MSPVPIITASPVKLVWDNASDLFEKLSLDEIPEAVCDDLLFEFVVFLKLFKSTF